MPTVSLDGSFSGLVWTLTLLPSKHTVTTIWHARPFTFQRPAYGHREK